MKKVIEIVFVKIVDYRVVLGFNIGLNGGVDIFGCVVWVCCVDVVY